MKKYILSPLCSAFIVPGLGQIINQSLKKGLFILSVVFFIFIVGTIKLFFILQSAIADINADRLNTASIGEWLSEQDLTLMWLLLGLLAIVWIYSILDAFWVGRELERQ